MYTGISISYAFFKVASSNNNANTNVIINGAALCMSFQLSLVPSPVPTIFRILESK